MGAVELSVGAIAATRIVLRVGGQVHGRLPAILIGGVLPMATILAVGVVYRADRRGRMRRA